MARLDDLTFAPAWQLRDLIRRRELSPVEITEHYLRRIEPLNPRLNAYLTVYGDEAVAAARAAEQAVMDGRHLRPLHGVPIAVKDLNPTKGIRTTRGSLVYKDWVPEEDDIVVERVRGAGAVILGKTNTPEFGARGTTENRLGDACRNPWNLERTAGGSSGGAGAALAAGLCPLATGSDAGGSIRIPGSFCGVYGIRPSQGRVPRPYSTPGGWGAFAQNGPMSHTVRDSAILLQVMAGPDARDPTCLQEALPSFEAAALDGGVRGLRMSWSADLGYAAVDPEVRQVAEAAASVLAELGASVEAAAPPIDGDKALDIFNTMWRADQAAEFGPLYETSADLLSHYFLQALEQAVQWKAGKLAQALRDREWHRARLDEFFQRYDLLLTPTMAVTAFPIEEFPKEIDGRPVDPA
ncbi:MAG: amidase, partial [Dehalococcoidia bacterium]